MAPIVGKIGTYAPIVQSRASQAANDMERILVINSPTLRLALP